MFSTKGNLITTKKLSDLVHVGYELMGRKRNILTCKMMSLMDDVKLLRDKVIITYRKAHYTLQQANILLGVINDLVETVPVDTGIHISYQSVMGVEIPRIQYDKREYRSTYGSGHTNSKLGYVYRCLYEVKEMAVILAEVENSIYRLANVTRKTQKRANALKNTVIPDFEHNVGFITDAFEERERGEFSCQKAIKAARDRRRVKESATQCHQLKAS